MSELSIESDVGFGMGVEFMPATIAPEGFQAQEGFIPCRGLFLPHASFEALKEPDGRVTLIRLRREDRKPRLVKPVVRKGLPLLPMDNGELDSEALDREIRSETIFAALQL